MSTEDEMRKIDRGLGFLGASLLLIFFFIGLLYGFQEKMKDRIEAIERRELRTIDAFNRMQSCSKGVAVLTPEGHATTICQP